MKWLAFSLMTVLMAACAGTHGTEANPNSPPKNTSSPPTATRPRSRAHGPAEVIIIRHGEKSTDEDPHLSDRGRQRANALVGYFTENPLTLDFGTPVAIYAAQPNHEDSAVRSIETVTPLSEHLGVKINSNFKRDDVEALVSEITERAEYSGKTVLICWPHQAIRDIAKAFGVAHPPKWNGATFDRAWKIRFSNDVESPDLADLPQHLLPGDSED